MKDLPIEHKIPLYPLLAPEGRRDVEAYVEQHPALGPALEEAREMDALLQDARLLDRKPDDDVLAYYLTHRYFSHHEPPPALAEALDRIEARLEAEDGLRERLEVLRTRLDAIEEETDPAAQFERLSGRSLDRAKRPTAARTDRPPVRTRIHKLGNQWPRYAIAASLVLAVVYVVLFLTSRALQPNVERLALVSGSEMQEFANLRMRGAAPADTTSTDQLFLRAVRLLENAYSSYAGLFPEYDDARVDSAATLLRYVIEHEEAESFIQLESYYFLGKAYLAQHDEEAAREALRVVVEQRGPHASEAEAILAELDQRGGR